MEKLPPTDIVTEADRKMAFVAKIEAIELAKDSDKIEFATVLGWKVVIQKDSFKVGDLCIYFTLMSILDPDNPNFDFRKDKSGVHKPLKSRKIKGVLTQGIIANISEVKFYGKDPTTLKEGDDVTELMKVKKFVEEEEAPIYTCEGEDLPEYIPRTEEERAQNIPKVLEELVGKEVIITRKEDGTSGSYILKDGEFIICSRNKVRNRDKDSKGEHYVKMAKQFNIEKGLRSCGKNMAIQGEIVGPKICKNELKLKEPDFRVFNIYWIDKKCFATYGECEEVCKALKLNMVPLLYRGPFKEEWKVIDGIMKYAETIEYNEGECAEGIVVKNDTPESRISFKVVSNKYLVKHNQ